MAVPMNSGQLQSHVGVDFFATKSTKDTKDEKDQESMGFLFVFFVFFVAQLLFPRTLHFACIGTT